MAGLVNLEQIALEAVVKRGAMQKASELAALLALLACRPIRNVLEIGSMHGGSLWAFSRVAVGRLVAVDLQVLEGRMEQVEDLDHTLIVADSSHPSTRARVSQLVPEGFDFIFIDGDHHYEAARTDLANWTPLLAPGGVLALHDICHRKLEGYDMWRLWQEVRVGREGYEIYDPAQAWGGIGVIAFSDLLTYNHTMPAVPLPAYTCPIGQLEPPPQVLHLHDR